MLFVFAWLDRRNKKAEKEKPRNSINLRYPAPDPYFGFFEREEQKMKTVSEAASERYPGATFDCALPQGWVDDCCDRGLDPRGHFVWLYADDVFGKPAPITAEGERISSVLLSHI